MYHTSVGRALALTAMGAAGTALGGLLVVAQPQMSFRRLGALQGLAAGLMLSISILDLLPEAAEEIGFMAANLCFYLGVLFFAAVVYCIPEPDDFLAKQVAAAEAAADQAAAAVAKKAQSSGVIVTDGQGFSTSTNLRGRAVLSRTTSTGADAAAAAVEVHPPVMLQQEQRQKQQPHQQPHQQPQAPGSPLSAASTSSADLDVMLEDPCNSDSGRDTAAARLLRRQLLMSGVVTAVGIALHNFPEGIAVFLAAQKSPAVGISLAVAIALHNIPEGVAVALPVWHATGSRLKGLQTAVLSGLAEPLAVVLLGLFFPGELNKHIVDAMLAGVGGIMAFLAFHELLPLAVQHAGKAMAVTCLFVGMAVMSFNLHLLNEYVLAGLH